MFRKLWNVKINAAARLNGTTYSKLIHDMKAKNIVIDRKVLAQVAEHHPEVFKGIVEAAK